MDEPAHHSDAKSAIAEEKPRDGYGHFIHEDKKTNTEATPSHVNPLSQFIHDETAIHKTNEDELIDVHVGNPLKRITDLLEQIKNQKAFTFNIKGSLGLAGIALVLGTFGIFGGTKALCDKGIQSESGVLKVLQATETTEANILDKLLFAIHIAQPKEIQRVVLFTPQSKLIHLVLNKTVNVEFYKNQNVVTTGSYDSCSDTQKIDSPQFIEILQ